MVTPALTTFLVSGAIFVLLVVLTTQERRHGRRFFASGFRAWLDRVIEIVVSAFERRLRHFVRYIIQLHWYYSIHSVLRTFLRGLVSVYAYFENVFERNRARTKALRAEKRKLHEQNHLQQMAEHRADTALTPAEQRKLRERSLAGDQ